jgi:hypothetical protein
VTLSVRWPGKIGKQGGGLISFFQQGLLVEGKSMSLLKFLLLFRCVFEAMVKVKVNLGSHKLFLHSVHIYFRCLVIVFVWI